MSVIVNLNSFTYKFEYSLDILLNMFIGGSFGVVYMGHEIPVSNLSDVLLSINDSSSNDISKWLLVLMNSRIVFMFICSSVYVCKII